MSGAYRLAIFLTIAALGLGIARPASADVVTDWNTTLLATVRAKKLAPPVASRALGMLHVAMYDSVMAVERTHRPYLIDRTAPEGTPAEVVAAQSAYEVLVSLFPDEADKYEARLNETLSTADGAQRRAAIGLGQEIGRAVVAWREDDGANAESDYSWGFEAGRWRPTPPDYPKPLLPQWRSLKPFAMQRVDQFRQPAPPALDSEEYAAALNEVKTLGADESEQRTAEQTEIARFWADGSGTATPPGHWNLIAQQIAEQRTNSLADNSRLFALLNVALADAAISCWDMKFHYDCWRPITAIRAGDTDGNPATDRDPNWSPLLLTPPFPSCSSGHSTFSGAAAVMLVLFYNTDEISFVTASEDIDATRSFDRISAAALEAGRSRIFGGIHFEFENQRGLAAGEALSKYVFSSFMQPRTAAEPSPNDRQEPADQVTQQPPAQTDAAGPTARAPSTATQQICALPPPPEVCCVQSPVQQSPVQQSVAATSDGWQPATTYYRYVPAPAQSWYVVPPATTAAPVTTLAPSVTTYYPVETWWYATP